MSDQLTRVTAVSVSETDAGGYYGGSPFKLGDGPFTDQTFSAQDDDGNFQSLYAEYSETIGPGRQTGQLFDDAGNVTGDGLASLQHLITISDPSTGDTFQVARVRLTEDDGNGANGALLGDFFIFSGPIDPTVTYQVTSIDYAPNTSPSYSYSNFSGSSVQSEPVCFAEGTLIQLANGLIPVEQIRPGDKIQTVDNGLQEVIWHGRRTFREADLARDARLRPILIAEGAVGNTTPLLVSQQHRIVLNEKFIKAKHMPAIQDMRARIANGIKEITYHHLLLEDHQVLIANGCEAESLFLGPVSMDILAASKKDHALLSDLQRTGRGHDDICRPMVRRGELKAMGNRVPKDECKRTKIRAD